MRKKPQKIKFSIIIPCYNEAENIPFLLEAFSFFKHRRNAELIIVDNGSTDETGAKLAELIPKYPFARSVKVKKNEGYGYGILRGLDSAKGDYIGWMHGDLQFEAKDFLRAASFINLTKGKKKLFVKGARCNRPLTDTLFTIAMAVFETLYMKMLLWDINGQPTMFHRSFLKHWKSPPHDFSLDLYAYISAKKRGLAVKRFDVILKKRKGGVSSWNTGFAARLKLIKNTLRSSERIKKTFL